MYEIDHSPIPYADLLARPGVVERLELRGEVGICAFHGGNLERETDRIAADAALRAGASLYTVAQPPGMRHHIPSARVDPAQSPALASFLDHCRWVITIHGYGRRDLFTSLLCGGGNRPFAEHVAGHLRDALPAYRAIDDLDRIPPDLRGLHPDNPCNLASGGGMQLELPPRVRGLTPLAGYWPSHQPPTGRFPHLARLVDGLVAAAGSWAGDPVGAAPGDPDRHRSVTFP